MQLSCKYPLVMARGIRLTYLDLVRGVLQAIDAGLRSWATFTSITDIVMSQISGPGKWAVLTWPAWLRVMALLPAIVLLWLAVLWALAGEALW